MEVVNVVDIETFGSTRLTPYCFSLLYRGVTRTAYGVGCVRVGLKWIFDNCISGSVFYAHNLSFDGGIILGNLDSSYNLEERGTLLRGGEIYSLAIKRGPKTIFLRCSAKLLPLRLEDMAAIFNIAKKGSIDHDSVNIDKIKDIVFREKAIKYCERDVFLVNGFLIKYINSIKPYVALREAYSISGIGVSIFRKYFNNFDISLKIRRDIDDKIRPAYYGGRCEVFGNKEEGETILHFDFSGMYTNRLLEEYPVGNFEEIISPSNITKPGFYYARVQSDLSLPILPYREETTGKLLFPNGFFSGLYWYEELLLFTENGGKILALDYAIIFEKTDFVFKKFGETCAQLRCRTTHDKIIWKLIPNSFIGRLGIRPESEETIIIPDERYDPRLLDVISDKRINDNWVVRIRTNNFSQYINGNVIYPAIVTSKARILWWKSAKEVEKRGGRVLYCDTDSIFAAFKSSNTPIGERNGEIYWDPEKEDTIIDEACFVTSKVYCIRYRVNSILKIKGVSKKYRNIFTVQDVWKLFMESESVNFKTRLFKKGFLNMKIEDIYKIIDFGSYDKRIFNKTKTRTSAILIKNTCKKYPI